MMKLRMLLFVLCASAACDKTKHVEAPPPAAPKPAGDARDLHGLTVSIDPQGPIHVVGKDKFGGRVDTLYENAHYLAAATASLKLSLTAEQVADLERLARELGGKP
jgi:hypothetical protein